MSTNQAAQQVQDAINDSIRENRIVHMEARIDTQEWVALADELLRASDDYAEQGSEIGETREYWGTDDDGDEWRVHLDGRA